MNENLEFMEENLPEPKDEFLEDIDDLDLDD